MKKLIPLLLFIYTSCDSGERANKASNTESTTLTSIDYNKVSTLNKASDFAKK